MFLYYLVFFLLLSCGLSNDLLKLEESDEAFIKEQYISAQISFTEDQPSHYLAEVGGCSFSPVTTIDTSELSSYSFQIQANDTNCLFKIISLTIADIVYDYSESYSTADWSEGTVHQITSNDGLKKVILTIDKTIPNSLSGNFSIIINLTTQNADLTKPSLQSTIPQNGAQGVSIEQGISLNFNEAIKAGSGQFTVFSGDENIVEFAKILSSDQKKVAISDKTLSLKLEQNFSNFTKYHLQIDSEAITDLDGNKFPGLSLGELSFITADANAPSLAFVNSIASINNDNTPSFTISSNKVGNISYSGSCSSSDNMINADEMEKTITFNTLADGTYTNCSLTVTATSGNFASLSLNSFVIDTQGPQLQSGSQSDFVDNLSGIASFQVTGDSSLTFIGNQNLKSKIAQFDDKKILTVRDKAGNSTQFQINYQQIIAASHSQMCAIKSDKTVDCWGYNGQGQTSVPANLGSVKAVSSGLYHNCAIKTDDTLQCWGNTPSIPSGLTTVKALAANVEYQCVIKNDDTGFCWDSSSSNNLGTVKAIAAGYYHKCFIKSDDTVDCIGDNNIGQQNIPTDLTALSISAGHSHTCAIKKSDKTVVCWGWNAKGQRTVPAGLGTVKSLSMGSEHSCAVKTDGTLVCWGRNDEDQLNIPGDLGSVLSATAGYHHTCAVKNDRSLVCWGKNDLGQSTVPADLASVKEHISFPAQ